MKEPQEQDAPPAPLKSVKRNISIFCMEGGGGSAQRLFAREVTQRAWVRTADALKVSEEPSREPLASLLLQHGYHWLKTGVTRNAPIGAGTHKNQDAYLQPCYSVSLYFLFSLVSH